jgi:hypothetical protein
MRLLCTGDLVRWRNPLYIVENGSEIDVSRWHHALVMSVTRHKLADTYERRDIKLMLLGPDFCPYQLEMSIEMFLEIGNIEKISRGAWVAVLNF